MSDFSKTLALIGLLTPLGASALGIGEIRTQSSLNQVLRAEIPLVLSGNDRLENIRIRLASPEAFQQAGVERQHGLTQLRFKPLAKPDGRHVIQVSSRDAITDPFLDFLVEVESPQGTVLREFTLLLDPSRSGTSRAQSPDVPAYPSRLAYDDEPAPRSRAASAPYPEPALEPPARDTDVGISPSRPMALGPEQLSGRTYGPVGRRENLIDVANRVERPAQVTPEQMALGLYLANPRAFARNINGLKAGSVLRIPNDTYLSSISQEEAQAALARRAGNSRRPAYAGHVPPPMSEMLGAGPVEETSSATKQGLAAKTPPSVVSEVAAQVPGALKKENEALLERLAQLEQRLNEAQRLLKLKDAELATLQSHQANLARESVPKSEPAAVPQPAPTVTQPPITVTPRPPVASTPQVEQPHVPATSPARPEPNQSQPPKPPVGAPKPVSPPPAEVGKPVAPVADMTMDDLPIPMNYWLASGGLVLLGLSALLYRLRRKPGEPDTEASKSDRLKSQTAEAAAPAAGPKPGESPATGTAEVTEIHPDQLDPAWEADVYLRYGRYPQAEALIRASLKKEPDREDLKLKLCEILNLSHQNEAFSAYIGELQAMGPRLSDGFWSSVQTMRPELIVDTMPQPAPAVEPDRTPSEPPAVDLVVTPTPPPTARLETETLDLDDTDFSAELLALEAQLGSLNEPVAVHPMDAIQPEAVSLSALDDDQSLEQALEALTDLKATPSSADANAEVSTLDLAEPSLATDVLSPQAPATDPEALNLDQVDELAELERLLEPTTPLANPEHEAAAVPHHDDATFAEIPAATNETSAAPPKPEHDNLLEFVPPVMAELLPAPPSEAPEPGSLVLENLIPFDTAGLSTASALPARPTAPVSESPVEPVAPVRNDELDFENLPAFDETSDAPGNAGFGVLDFELELLDPLTQAGSDPELAADSGQPKSSPLDIARRLAEDGDKIAARTMLKELIQAGDASVQNEARLLLEEISKVRLSLVSGPASETPPEVPYVPPAKATPGA